MVCAPTFQLEIANWIRFENAFEGKEYTKTAENPKSQQCSSIRRYTAIYMIVTIVAGAILGALHHLVNYLSFSLSLSPFSSIAHSMFSFLSISISICFLMFMFWCISFSSTRTRFDTFDKKVNKVSVWIDSISYLTVVKNNKISNNFANKSYDDDDRCRRLCPRPWHDHCTMS